MWQVVYAKPAQKDTKKAAEAGLKPKIERLVSILATNPFQNLPPYKKLMGDLAETYSCRITIQHRLIYEVFERKKTVRILRMWSHYE